MPFEEEAVLSQADGKSAMMTTLVMETTGVPAYQESSINYVSDTVGKESKNETAGNPME